MNNTPGQNSNNQRNDNYSVNMAQMQQDTCNHMNNNKAGSQSDASRPE